MDEDLVSRLTSLTVSNDDLYSLRHDAADEIKRLRKQKEILIKCLKATVSDDIVRQVLELLEEV